MLFLYNEIIIIIIYSKYRKRDDSNIQVHNTIFSKYLALPIATFPIKNFSGSDEARTRVYFRDKEVPYQLGY